MQERRLLLKLARLHRLEGLAEYVFPNGFYFLKTIEKILPDYILIIIFACAQQDFVQFFIKVGPMR
ncbi:hypothetical protein C8244_03985 [Paracidovorax avenae]|nr:hypothetical protein C8244_03985 [Paracidovorax avenae]